MLGVNSTTWALRPLTPETLACLEAVSFRDRAHAIPGVVRAHESITPVTLTGQNDYDGAVTSAEIASICDFHPDTEERQMVLADYIIAGGLEYDRDADKPLFAGGGEIIELDRDEEALRMALGLDGHGDKWLEHEAVDAGLAHAVNVAIDTNDELRLALCRLMLKHPERPRWVAFRNELVLSITDKGWQSGLDDIAHHFLDAPCWSAVDPEWRDALDPIACILYTGMAQSVWDTARRRGLIGNPMAVALDGSAGRYGGGYSVGECDEPSCKAVWIPDEIAESEIRLAAVTLATEGMVRADTAAGVSQQGAWRFSLDAGATWSQAYPTVGRACAAWLSAVPDAAKDRYWSCMRQSARDYCERVLAPFNAWLYGDVYEAKVHVMDRRTGQLLDVHTSEIQGRYGYEDARRELDSEMLMKAETLLAARH